MAALGFGAGCVLWVKFTMMGFFLSWVLAVLYLRAGWLRQLGFCLLNCHNVSQLLRPAEELPQYQFAAIMQENGGGSLLNYGTLDGGFYTAAGVQPPCRFFCVTNLPMPEQQEQQNALMEFGGVDFAVSLDPSLAERFDYTLTAQAEYDGGEGSITWYLYRKNS